MSTIQILLTIFAGIIGSNVIAELIRQRGETKRQKDKQMHDDTKVESDDMKAVNTADDPDRILPRELPLSEKTVLPAHSWNVIRFRY